MHKHSSLQGYQVLLRPIQQSDLEQLRQWRNSTHIRQFMLDQSLISKEQQTAWFEHIKRAENQQHFVIEYKHTAIGSCNIKTRGHKATLDTAKQFELGLYIGEEQYMGNIIAFAPTLLMNDYCFDVLGAEQLHAVVKSSNTMAMRYNEKLGYEQLNDGDLCDLVLNRQRYAEHSKVLKQFLNRPARTKR